MWLSSKGKEREREITSHTSPFVTEPQKPHDTSHFYGILFIRALTKPTHVPRTRKSTLPLNGERRGTGRTRETRYLGKYQS